VAGLVVGAYHFANPDNASGDAQREADLFLSVAKPAPGELISALDLEVNHGLPPAALSNWVQTWLERVSAATGQRPMIYTTASFWKSNLADTTWFAQHGYRLWIANWGVTNPSVPAGNWTEQGWSFWQYSSCGKIAGIRGCVDLDRYHGQLADLPLIP